MWIELTYLRVDSSNILIFLLLDHTPSSLEDLEDLIDKIINE